MADLRSDTVTKPTDAMRAAMANAEVGDDVLEDDPTVTRLEAETAALLGKEAGVFVPSGSMSNLLAIMVHCRELGSEFIVGNRAHMYINEQGSAASLAGVHPMALATQPDGSLDLAEVAAAVRAKNVHFPVTRMVCIENTHNSCGGKVLPVEYMDTLGALAREHGLTYHVDGARLMNAAAQLGVPAARVVQAADTVSLCLSKGLGAPVGSVLVGPADFVARARHYRKALGGGMRQVGVLAAAGLIALNDMPALLPEDHRRAQELYAAVAALPGVQATPPDTNMVFWELPADSPRSAADVSAALAADHGVRIGAVGPKRLRAVLHHQVDDAGLAAVVAALRSVLG